MMPDEVQPSEQHNDLHLDLEASEPVAERAEHTTTDTLEHQPLENAPNGATHDDLDDDEEEEEEEDDATLSPAEYVKNDTRALVCVLSIAKDAIVDIAELGEDADDFDPHTMPAALARASMALRDIHMMSSSVASTRAELGLDRAALQASVDTFAMLKSFLLMESATRSSLEDLRERLKDAQVHRACPMPTFRCELVLADGSRDMIDAPLFHPHALASLLGGSPKYTPTCDPDILMVRSFNCAPELNVDATAMVLRSEHGPVFGNVLMVPKKLHDEIYREIVGEPIFVSGRVLRIDGTSSVVRYDLSGGLAAAHLLGAPAVNVPFEHENVEDEMVVVGIFPVYDRSMWNVAASKLLDTRIYGDLLLINKAEWRASREALKPRLTACNDRHVNAMSARARAAEEAREAAVDAPGSVPAPDLEPIVEPD